MKMFLTLIAFVSMTHAFAQAEYTAIKEGDISLSGVAGEIVSVKKICPRTGSGISCMAYGSTVKVKVTTGSCINTFGGYFSSFKVVDGKGVLSFGALVINNEAATRVRCYAISNKIIDIFIPFEGKVTLENMEYQGDIAPVY
jgi:hypothetical protein